MVFWCLVQCLDLLFYFISNQIKMKCFVLFFEHLLCCARVVRASSYVQVINTRWQNNCKQPLIRLEPEQQEHGGFQLEFVSISWIFT